MLLWFFIFLFFSTFYLFALFEILQAGWGADFATRFGGTKVTLVGLLSSRSLYWSAVSAKKVCSWHPIILAPIFCCHRKIDFWRNPTILGTRRATPGWFGPENGLPSSQMDTNWQIESNDKFQSMFLAFHRLPAQCLQCPSPSSRGTPMPSATSTLKQISERLTTLRFYYQKVRQFT